LYHKLSKKDFTIHWILLQIGIYLEIDIEVLQYLSGSMMKIKKTDSVYEHWMSYIKTPKTDQKILPKIYLSDTEKPISMKKVGEIHYENQV
jgi:hypothetical protein